jgi:hypothetical protein
MYHMVCMNFLVREENNLLPNYNIVGKLRKVNFSRGAGWIVCSGLLLRWLVDRNDDIL